MTTAALVHDEGAAAGLGHQRRMEALDGALRRLGVESRLLPNATSAAADIVVVDSYVLRADARDRFEGRVVAGVDDLCRDLVTRVVVDPSPGATRADHPASPRVLAGAAFALLPPARSVRSPDADDRPTVLVTTGGADRSGVGATIASHLVANLPLGTVTLTVGPWGSRPDLPSVRVVVAPRRLDEHLAAAGVVVTAGGVTMLEALRLGCPTVAVTVADNQARAVEGATRAGAVVPATPATAGAAALDLLADAATRRDLAVNGRRLVDGWGAHRVADVLVEEVG